MARSKSISQVIEQSNRLRRRNESELHELFYFPGSRNTRYIKNRDRITRATNHMLGRMVKTDKSRRILENFAVDGSNQDKQAIKALENTPFTYEERMGTASRVVRPQRSITPASAQRIQGSADGKRG